MSRAVYTCRACGKVYIETRFGPGRGDYRIDGPDGTDVVRPCTANPRDRQRGPHDFDRVEVDAAPAGKECVA